MMIISVKIAGIAWHLLQEQTGSIWSSVMIHCLYNILSGESQIFILMWHRTCNMDVYTVNSKNMLLTGINGFGRVYSFNSNNGRIYRDHINGDL